ncbi:MAG: O-antigen ligase family protein [Bdellovibrionales bacterium]|nr:O-antigen ligase family protein [Bdellovibrionales bacterium]
MSTNSAKISHVTGILLLLFAISTLVSQSLMDLFSTLLCLYLAFQWLMAKKQNRDFQAVQKMGFDWLWLAWFVVCAIGFALNRPPPPETPENFWMARLVEFKWIFILYFMVGGLHLAKFKEDSMKWFNGAVLLCSAYAIVDYFLQVQNATPTDDVRLGGLFQFSMTYAHSYGIFFCALLGLFFEISKTLPPKKRLFYLCTLIVLGLSVLLTYTRGVWIAAFVSVIAISFLWRVRNGFIAIIACSLGAAVLYFAVPSVKNRVDFTAKIADASTAKQTYDSERVVLWKTNLMIFKDHPWFGTGYGQNKFHLHEYYEKQGLPKDQFIGHAHNQYLHLLAGTGVLGLLCYLGLLGTMAVMTLVAFLKIPKENLFYKGLALGALGGQICFAVGSLTESNFEHSKVRFAIMFMWAIGLWLWQETKQKKALP